MIQFKSKIKIRDGNPYVLVNAKRAESLKQGWHKPMPVLVQINRKPDIPWKINMMPAGDGSFYLYLHGDVRKASGTKVEDIVNVSVEFDFKYKSGPAHPMQDWFRIPLEKNAKARKAWESLTPSRQKEILRYFSWLKSDDAKKRNAERLLYVLSGKEGRFMAQSWKDGKVYKKTSSSNNKKNVSKEKYRIMEEAIIALFKKHKELTFTELVARLEERFMQKFDGSIRYYALTVKSGLEEKGIIEQSPKSKQLQLK